MSFMLGSYQGPVNQVLGALGLVDQPIKFLSDPDVALWSVIGVQIWKATGHTMIYWLAALQTVPSHLLRGGPGRRRRTAPAGPGTSPGRS